MNPTQKHMTNIRAEQKNLTPRQYAELLLNLTTALTHEFHTTQNNNPTYNENPTTPKEEQQNP